MTPQELAEIDKRMRAISEGPWMCYHGDQPDSCNEVGRYSRLKEDSDFIVHAPKDMQKLIWHAQSLKALLEGERWNGGKLRDLVEKLEEDARLSRKKTLEEMLESCKAKQEIFGVFNSVAWNAWDEMANVIKEKLAKMNNVEITK